MRRYCIGIANDNLWGRFCRAIGREELIADPRFKTNPDRVQAFRRNGRAGAGIVVAAPARRMGGADEQDRRAVRADQHPR